MSIFLKPVQRYNPQKPDEPQKWYPVQYTTKLVDENEVAMMIADETTLNPMEAAMAIRQLRKVVERLLLDGKSVRLGDWGTFNVSLNTEGADTKEALTASNVKKVNVNFQAGADLRAAMQKADFVWLNKIFEENGVSYELTKTWTTDALYKETKDKLKDRVSRGCKVVEMECASIMAVAKSRGFKAYQFLYTDDTLEGDIWEMKTLTEDRSFILKQCLNIAFEVIKKI